MPKSIAIESCGELDEAGSGSILEFVNRILKEQKSNITFDDYYFDGECVFVRAIDLNSEGQLKPIKNEVKKYL